MTAFFSFKNGCKNKLKIGYSECSHDVSRHGALMRSKKNIKKSLLAHAFQPLHFHQRIPRKAFGAYNLINHILPLGG